MECELSLECELFLLKIILEVLKGRLIGCLKFRSDGFVLAVFITSFVVTVSLSITTEYLSLESCEEVEMMMLSQNDLQKSGRRLRQLS